MLARRKSFQGVPLTPDELLLKLENFCAYRERCPKEVRLKLAELGAEKNIANEIFLALETDKFFDETRFALAYAGGKFRNNNWGKVRIKMELRMREISPDIIQQALEAIDPEEYQLLLLKLLQRKYLQYTGDEKAREKTAASLIRSGFEPDLVFRNLSSL
jgi:regulatory protein